MLVRPIVSCSVVALFAVSAGGTAAMERPAVQGIPLAQEMVADEKPPPSRAAAQLADAPLRTRFPSRTFLPALPEVGFADPASSLAAADETQLVRLVYDTYSRYSERADGERVEFELDDFRTVYREQFDGVAYYPELMSLTSDWRVKASILGYSEDGGARRVRYEVEWVPGHDLDDRPDLRAFLGMSARDMLAVVAAEHPTWRRAAAITSYRVRLSYLGRSQTYRAGFVWLVGDRGELDFSVVDAAVPEIALAVLESDLPAAEHERRNADLPFDRTFAASTTTSCIDQTWPTVNSTQQAKYNSYEHTSGKHEGVYIGAFDCSCDSTCLSRCDPGFEVEACQDYGGLTALGLLHEVAKRSEIASGTSQDGHYGGAQCASGLGCFVQSCIGSSCGGTSIEVSGGVGGLTFTTSAATILDASLTHSHICGRCTETETQDDTGTITTFDQGDGGTDPSGGGDEPADGSPIVIDLDRGGFRFTDLAGGVRFDLDGDGRRELVSWLAPGSGDGWLALDRDGDGAIATGAELFGNFTPQPPSAAPHGFVALAMFDAAAEGGDGDGRITAGDAVFAALRLWLDGDHDGASRPEELLPLADAGIAAIDLAHVESRRRDRHGNELRYTSRVDLADAATSCTDVFLLRRD